MSDITRISRRALLKGAAVGAFGLAAPGLSSAFAAGALTVGFVYVGSRDDYGYNQAHAAGASAVKAMGGVKVLEEERVPETIEVQKTLESMIALDGAGLLFPTSFGYYDPHVLKMAAKHKKTTFMHAGGLWSEGHPDNAHSYFGYIDEAQHLSGIVAAHVTKSKKLGFIAAKPIPQVLRNINAFALGARSVDPSITVQVVFTGDWSMPVKEAEATNSLIDQGVDVVTCHVDSPKVIVTTAEGRGIFTCGYHASQASLAPKGYLTGAEWNWESLYPSFVTKVLAGETIPHIVRGGLKAGVVKRSPYGAAVPEAARKRADSVFDAFMTKDYAIFTGPIRDNKGNSVIAAGAAQGQTDIALEKMNYLVEGVVGSLA
ncbi:MAG: BMP family ABC transporter substrate-binding protein [Alphaproteobacteria bacterium]|nr:BMP family ABC transporter substrate-binding protein [Alphaproteobacteria bacterium]